MIEYGRRKQVTKRQSCASRLGSMPVAAETALSPLRNLGPWNAVEGSLRGGCFFGKRERESKALGAGGGEEEEDDAETEHEERERERDRERESERQRD